MYNFYIIEYMEEDNKYQSRRIIYQYIIIRSTRAVSKKKYSTLNIMKMQEFINLIVVIYYKNEAI